jgi:hypothetical protein
VYNAIDRFVFTLPGLDAFAPFVLTTGGKR